MFQIQLQNHVSKLAMLKNKQINEQKDNGEKNIDESPCPLSDSVARLDQLLGELTNEIARRIHDILPSRMTACTASNVESGLLLPIAVTERRPTK